MKEKVLNSINMFKGWWDELKDYYKSIPVWKKIIFIIIIFICKFVLPDLIAFPALIKWVRKHKKPIEA